MERQAIHDFLSIDEQKLLMQLMPDEILLLDPDSLHVVYANHAPKNTDLEQILHQPYLNQACPSSRQHLSDMLKQVLEQSAILMEEVQLLVAGQPNWYIVRTLPVIRQDKLVYILITHTDINTQKNAAIELELSKSRLKNQLDETPLAAMVWDKNGITIEWNPAAEATFLYSAEEAIGQHFTDLIVPQDKRLERRQQFAFAAQKAKYNSFRRMKIAPKMAAF